MRENDHGWFIRMAALLAILAALLAVGNIVLGFAAVGFTSPPDTFSNVSSALPIEGIDAGLLRWSTICDLFGHYLLVGPLALELSRQFGQPRPQLMQLSTYCALGYVLVGVLLLIPIWTFSCGIDLLRHPEHY